jgi:hypothetical protein
MGTGVAFLRVSRDKRGYEHFYLMQPPSRGKGRPRVLYWFRTPPNVRIGRAPLDPEIQRALESQNPDIAFDWKAIARTPTPPPMESEHWRERRRAERAMRAAEAEQTDSEGVEVEAVIPPDITTGPPDADVTTSTGQPDSRPAADMALATSEASAGADSASQGTGTSRRRRRRRRKLQKNEAVREAPAVQEFPQASQPPEPEDGV